MKFIGAHVSANGGVFTAPERAFQIGANCFAFFLKNQRQWVAKPYTAEEIEKFKQELKKYKFQTDKILPHSGYLINLGSGDAVIAEKSLQSFIDELRRVKQLGLKYLNIHPGSHKNLISESECIKLIAGNINSALDAVEEVSVVLENTAGQGSAVGYRFQHLRDIIDLVKEKHRVGCCLDTCHAFAAGYKIDTANDFQKVMDEFTVIIGKDKLWAAHLNDAKNAFNSKVDRHQNLLRGNLTVETFSFIINSDCFENIPLILETIDESLWAEEISWLFSLQNNYSNFRK